MVSSSYYFVIRLPKSVPKSRMVHLTRTMGDLGNIATSGDDNKNEYGFPVDSGGKADQKVSVSGSKDRVPAEEPSEARSLLVDMMERVQAGSGEEARQSVQILQQQFPDSQEPTPVLEHSVAEGVAAASKATSLSGQAIIDELRPEVRETLKGVKQEADTAAEGEEKAKEIPKIETEGNDEDVNTEEGHIDVLERVKSVVVDTLKITECFIQPDREGLAWEISFVLPDITLAEEAVQMLHHLGVGRLFGSYTVIPTARHVASSQFPAVGPPHDDLVGKWESGAAGRNEEGGELEPEIVVDLGLVQTHVRDSIIAGSTVTFDYIMLCIIAGLIAAVGLCVNSTVAVVASMLVSPLMGPNLAVCLGAATYDWKMTRHGVIVELASIFLCIVIGISFFLLPPSFSALTYKADFNCSLPCNAGLIVGVGYLHQSVHLKWPSSEMASRGTLEGAYVFGGQVGQSNERAHDLYLFTHAHNST